MKTYHRGLIDLHLHLDGSLSMDSVKRLAALKGVQLPDDETLLQQLQVQPDCRNLNEYLEKFAFPCSLLQSEEAISLAVQTLCEELQAQGLIYGWGTEIPQAMWRGLKNKNTYKQPSCFQGYFSVPDFSINKIIILYHCNI